MNIKLLTQFSFTIILLILSISCSSPKKEETEPIGEPQIRQLQVNYDEDCFIFENFQDNETYIKFLFDYVKHLNGSFIVITNEDGVHIDNDDSVFNYDKTDVFSFRKKGGNFEFITLRPIVRLKEYAFIKKENLDTVEYHGSFESLNINILQNFIKLFNVQKRKGNIVKRTLELYNKDNIKKVVIIYHNYGEWFSIDIL